MKQYHFPTALISLGVFLLVGLPAWAVAPTAPVSSTIPGNYYTWAGVVGLASPVESDVMVGGKQVDVHTEVGGDVLAVAGKMRIAGTVMGNVRVMGGEVEISGTVGRNVTIVGGTVIFTPQSRVFGHVLVAGGTVKFNGVIDGSVKAAGRTVSVAGTIKGPIDILLDNNGQLEIGSSAVTTNSFNYRANNEATILSGAKLAQTPVRQSLPPVPSNRFTRDWWWGQLAALFSAWVLAMVLTKLIPKKVIEVAEEGLTNQWRSLGWGAVFAVIVPMVCILLLFTVIGVSLAIVLAAVYIIFVILAQVMFGVIFGKYLQSIKQLSVIKKWPIFPVALMGILGYRILIAVPYVGWLVCLVGALIGWGALLIVKRRFLSE